MNIILNDRKDIQIKLPFNLHLLIYSVVEPFRFLQNYKHKSQCFEIHRKSLSLQFCQSFCFVQNGAATLWHWNVNPVIWFSAYATITQCLKRTKNVAFEFWYFSPFFVRLILTSQLESRLGNLKVDGHSKFGHFWKAHDQTNPTRYGTKCNTVTTKIPQ